MGDLVSDGTAFTCPFCTTKLKISVSSPAVQGKGKNLANIENFTFPPPPGGQCLVSPATPVPCTPSVVAMDPGQGVVTIQKGLALGSACQCLCAKGGLVTVADPGQTVVQTI